ncbi:hypothetical protein KDK_11080 [Dictyobacter kobayashii]|uniref:Uncharacterized protein n=1 Tax=Dictyobacter kobayashii TaxID=2014872 RepID=A0A402ADY0_9CHLR|nr:hypothetical protein KDK_11080 [Dictyobacter kobayashii]
MGATKTWQFVLYILFYLCLGMGLLWEAFSQKPSALIFIILLLGGCANLLLLVITVLLLFIHLKKSPNSQQTL